MYFLLTKHNFHFISITVSKIFLIILYNTSLNFHEMKVINFHEMKAN